MIFLLLPSANSLTPSLVRKALLHFYHFLPHQPSFSHCRWQNICQVWSEVIGDIKERKKKSWHVCCYSDFLSVHQSLWKGRFTSCGHLDLPHYISQLPHQQQLNHKERVKAHRLNGRRVPSACPQHIHPDGKLLHLPAFIGFISPSVMDFAFSAFFHYWSSAPFVTHHCTLFAQCHSICSSHRALLLHNIEAHVTLVQHCWSCSLLSSLTYLSTPPPSLHLVFLVNFAHSSSAGKLSFSESLSRQAGGGEVGGWRWGGGGDYDRSRMKRVGNKVTLIRTCQEQCTHKASWESNLVLAVSLSDISAISHHRSGCEPDMLSDFLKCHKQKHKGMSILWGKKKKLHPSPASQMDQFFIYSC